MPNKYTRKTRQGFYISHNDAMVFEILDAEMVKEIMVKANEYSLELLEYDLDEMESVQMPRIDGDNRRAQRVLTDISAQILAGAMHYAEVANKRVPTKKDNPAGDDAESG